MNATVVRRLRSAGLLGLALVLGGCAFDVGDDLVIASPWPASERATLEASYNRWVAQNPGAGPTSIRIGWVALDPGDDPARVVRRRPPIDLLLGAPASVFETLARSGALGPSETGDAPWRVVRRSPIGLATNPSSRHPGPIFADPRHDPIALAWLRTRLDSEGWTAGYAKLVREAGRSRRIVRRADSALAAVRRGQAGSTPTVIPAGEKRHTSGYIPRKGPAEWVEGVAPVAGGRHLARARDFLRFLVDKGWAERPEPHSLTSAEAGGLLADLLGATLVDAQDELWDGWASLDRVGESSRSEKWMTEAPPWPPASVVSLRSVPESAPLVETLAAEVAPDPEVRAWLLRSWNRPSAPIDGDILCELAEAAGGRLSREPRFRSWLRAEWTAWARQRYRRVADGAGEASP